MSARPAIVAGVAGAGEHRFGVTVLSTILDRVAELPAGGSIRHFPTKVLAVLRERSPADVIAWSTRIWLGLLLLGSVVLSPLWLRPANADEPIDFARQIQPIFANHCIICHGPDTAEGGLRLDDPEVATRPLESGMTAVVAGTPDASQLWLRVTSTDAELRMPPEGEGLSGPQQQAIRKWLLEGAPFTQHWAYRPVEDVKLPTIHGNAWPNGAIDTFILAELELRELTPSPRAEAGLLLKRLCYDLWGLPPTPELRERFLRDPRPDAYERLVDEVLASPLFGERWGRHWLDLARYADSDGYEKDNPRPHAWKYRDWVLQAMNRDVPFDQFTVQQLAGDLLPDPHSDDLLATAFHRQTLTNTEGGTDQEEFRVAATFDRVETTATVWLSLTVGCARCHDHKYDSISQRDYYDLFALFNNLDEYEAPMPVGRPGEPDQTIPVGLLRERTEERRTTHILQRGDFLRPGDKVEPAALSAIRLPIPVANRKQLADWLLDPRNPLTSRVMVNHVWLHLFGRGIVATVDDFGVRGELPSHPQLLDYLAASLSRHGWSRKQLIRMIVLSNTYQQSSTYRVDAAQLDVQNRWLHRQNRFRVEAESVRDIFLELGGRLALQLGGPSVFPPMDKEVAALSYANNFKWETSAGGNAYRRGMYTFFKRTAPHPNLTTFDCPDANTTRVQRDISNSPLQPLVTLNNRTFVEASYGLASRILRLEPGHSAGSVDATRLAVAYVWCVQREATESVLQPLLELLEQSRQYYIQHPDAVPPMQPFADRSTAPAHELAAWSVVARCILNLEPVLVRE